MNCPVCGNNLKEIDAHGIKIDVCDNGCGGLWFDNFEMKKFDEPHESAEILLDINKKKGLKMVESGKRKCPKCTGIKMSQHFFSIKRKVTIDECPNCGGIWLDAGELADIRSLYGSEEERKKAFEEFFSKEFAGGLSSMQAESSKQAQDARRFANMFRYICPTNYIPGKQDWGAF